MRAEPRPHTEILEQRIAPATITNPLAIGGTTQATFTDSDGDLVTVRISGSAGSVTFLDGGGNPVDDGDNIASVEITGGSPNFVLTYSVDVVGAGEVAMGNITSDKIIRGIFSIPDSTAASSFVLGSFEGVNFSTDGGLAVDRIAGNATGMGLKLSGGLHKEAVIAVRSSLEADVTLGDGKDLVDGTLVVQGSSPGTADFTVNGTTGPNFSWVQSGSFEGAVSFNGAFNGSITIDGQTNGSWNFTKGVAAAARLHSDDWDNLQVTGPFAGMISSSSSDVIMTLNGDLKSTARIQGSGGVTLTISGNVLPGASAVCDNGLTFSVGGNMSGTFVAGSGDLLGTVGGSVTGASLIGSSDTSITVSGNVTKSTIAGDNELFLDIDGGVTDSDISSGHNVATLTIDGAIKGSRFSGETTGTIGNSITGSRFRASGFDDVTLTVAGSVTSTIIETDDEIALNVTGSVSKSRFIATTGGVSLTVGGDLLKVTAISSDDDIMLDVDGNVDGAFYTDDSSQTWTIGGNFKGLFMTGSGDLTMSVGGSVLKGSQFYQGDSLSIAVDKDFEAIVFTDALDLKIDGNVKAGTRITANSINDLGDADASGFSVGGGFAGWMDVGRFDPSSDGTSGQTHLLVSGIVAKTARWVISDIAGTSTGETYSFPKGFLGRLVIGSNLDVDLDFGASVAKIIVGGAIQGDVSVTGKLAQIVAGGSLFVETTPGMAGNFRDGAGTTTGTLNTTAGYGSVVPLA
jgi:hypothetical protein